MTKILAKLYAKTYYSELIKTAKYSAYMNLIN